MPDRFHIAGRFRAHCAAVAFPSLRRFLTRRTCLPATGKNSAAPKRTFSSALVSAEWRAQRENDIRTRTSLFAKDYPAFLSTMPQGVSEHAAAFLPFTFSTSI